MSALDARGNKVVSLLGRAELQNYKDDMATIFERNKTPGGSGLISGLEKLIEDNSPYKSPEYDRLGEVLGKLNDLENEQDSNPANEL
jgi:hypothetical protein